jgi:Zn-dependent protease
MGWESRNYGPTRGGDGLRGAIGRIFGDASNPWGWSLPLYRLWGIQVRVHLVFLIMIAWELVAAAFKGVGELQWAAMWTGGLFILVLLHEYGHCFACRWVGGEADQILMWPLGGLASCAPPPRWKADLITTTGGPAVNALLWPILGAALWVLVAPATRLRAVLFNPLDPKGAALFVHLEDGSRPWWLQFLWLLYLTNGALFLFNMLLVMYPMDSGRIVRDLLWARIGHQRATLIVATLGIGVAVALFIYGMSTRQPMLTSVAIFGGIVCWVERKTQLTMVDAHPSIAGYDFDRGYRGMPGADDEDRARERRAREASKRRDQEEEEQAELDRILAKIARTGMASLTTSEKRWLERATERRRRA